MKHLFLLSTLIVYSGLSRLPFLFNILKYIEPHLQKYERILLIPSLSELSRFHGSCASLVKKKIEQVSQTCLRLPGHK